MMKSAGQEAGQLVLQLRSWLTAANQMRSAQELGFFQHFYFILLFFTLMSGILGRDLSREKPIFY